MIEKYYEEELRYLYESGREFAKAHPDRAQFLNIDSVGDRDPYVERLFEGFAFLAARIREKLDDSFPQLTEGIINLLWPQLLQEIPSTAIAQFSARTGLLQEAKVLPRGSEVLSGSVGPESTVCRFITTQDVLLVPLSLSGMERATDSWGNEQLSFHFKLDQGASWNALSLKSLRLYLHAELPTALMLHENCTTSVVRAQLSVDNGQLSVDIAPPAAVTPGGLHRGTALLPHDQRAFWGYSLLREYFIYPEKFLFLDLNGFDTLPFCDPEPATVTYTLTLSKQFVADKPFTAEAFRLFCSPVVNVSLQETEPVARTGLQSEYRVVANASSPLSTHVHSIVSVTGVDRVTGERNAYDPLYTFRHATAPGARTFVARFVRTPAGKRELYLVTGGNQMTEKGELRDENLSIMAWCSNGEIPRDYIREGGINRPGKGFPDYVRITNITRPTLPCKPPEDDTYLWMFQSHLSSTWASLASADTLKSFLKLYDWSGQEGRSRRIDAISEVTSESAQTVIGGCPVRGARVTVTLLETEFRDSGDIHLFGMVLGEFLGQFVSINSFLELQFVQKPSGRTMLWKPVEGKRCLI
jgi:type VI secretion system protein ImpG